MQLPKFKIRCSAIGQIMTNPRSKTETLSQTTKTYVETWVKEQIYGTKKTIKSKYLTKGIDVEDVAIDYYAEVKGLGFILKNQDHFQDDYVTGTPDLIIKDEVIDLKSSWDCFTFPLFDEIPDKAYEYQLQGYMGVTGLKKARLVYTLQNTPDELEWDEPIDYTGLDSRFRMKEYEFAFDADLYQSICDRVLECRDYVKFLSSKL